MSPDTDTREPAWSHPGEDSLIDLVNGLLDPQAAELCLEHLRGCTSCEEQLRVLTADREWTNSRPQPMLRHGRLAPRPDDDRPRDARGSRAPMWAAVAIAATVLLAVAVTILLRTDDPLDYWLPTEMETIALRSEAAGGSSDFLAAIEAYRDRDAVGALQQLERTDAPEGFEELRQLYLASALCLNDRPAEAVAILVRLDVPTLPQPWRRRAEWVQYVALRRAGRDSSADALLQVLARRPGEIGGLARREADRITAP